MYYTTFEHLLKIYDSESRKFGFKSKNSEEHDKWKIILREKLKDITGITKMKTCDLNQKILESEQLDGYRRVKAIIQTEPDVWMPFYILIPDNLKTDEKRPCIIAPHGHGSAGKEGVAGRVDIDGVKESIDKYNHNFAESLVKKGYIVFCNDARGSGERRELKNQGNTREALFSSSCNDLNNAAISLGQSLTGMWIWDLMRLIDYIETCEYCDSDKIACCGFSGGGLQSLWLTALDDRVKCAVVSGYYHSYKGSILRTNFCGCNFVPHLWETIDICDLGAMIAPRPLLIESGNKDKLNGDRGISDAIEQVNITRCAYKLYNAEDNICHHVFEGVHEWNGEKTGEFFDKFL